MSDEKQMTREERLLEAWDREMAALPIEQRSEREHALAHALRNVLTREKAARDAALEEAAERCDVYAEAQRSSLRRLAALDARDAWTQTDSRARAASTLSRGIRAIKSEAAR